MFMCTYALHTVYYTCFPIQIIDIHVFTSFLIYYHSFMLLVIAYTCMPKSHHLIMYTRDCLICTPRGFIMCTRGLHLTTLDPRVHILESGPWWSCCSWSECVADPFVVIRVQQKFGHRRSSSFLLISWLAPETLLVAHEHLSAFVTYFCIFWWCNILVILYHSLW